ncbi:RNA polymerase sigma-F factor [Oxobacter pfennigii]|uniref:RNA polymerase sigma-F factor n=1 Tax=Oxobacter pfennigii TaxID=36849 RepID=A0A0P8WRZ9_9CLOT|nr:RNA polymerase sporulation sigma factor SigF [Oxobacter pfennigii]KPU45347.1 RNA polymerase sigma-F factor [Oxobacter pfennigii]
MSSKANSKGISEILSHEETLELISKSQKGDKLSEEILIKRNVGLISSIAKRFMNRGYEFEDLFQIGSIGIIKAIKNFDTTFSVKFSTYAVPMIMGEIKRFIRDDGIIKVSRSMKDVAKKAKVAKERMAKELGREPTIAEISEELGITTEDLVVAMDSAISPEYLYDVIHQDDGSPVLLIDKLSEEKDVDSEITDRIALKEVLDKLEPKARQIIILRYFKDKTQTEIAKMMGISQVQVSRIEKKVLEKMKEIMT